MIENTIGVDNVDYMSPRRSICTPDIVHCDLQKVKKQKGGYEKKQQIKKSSRNIKNSNAPNLKLAANGVEVFLNAP